MSMIHFSREKPADDVIIEEKAWNLLTVFLQPGSDITLPPTANSILDILPENQPLSAEVWNFGETCIEVAEQIPYHHSSHVQLAALLEVLRTSPKLVSTFGPDGLNTIQYNPCKRLRESLREGLNGPHEGDPRAYVNFNAFVANLQERHVHRTSPTFAIWAHREAFESERPKDQSDGVREAIIMSAAQHILWNGQGFFKQILYPGDVTDLELQHWIPGSLYKGEKGLHIDRWHFWRDGYRTVAAGVIGEKLDGKTSAASRIAMNVGRYHDG